MLRYRVISFMKRSKVENFVFKVKEALENWIETKELLTKRKPFQ